MPDVNVMLDAMTMSTLTKKLQEYIARYTKRNGVVPLIENIYHTDKNYRAVLFTGSHRINLYWLARERRWKKADGY